MDAYRRVRPLLRRLLPYRKGSVMTPKLLNLLQRIATAYDTRPHTPHDTAVQTAYDAFKSALLIQYRAIPYRVLFVDENPYATSADMFRMVEHSGILHVYTKAEFPSFHPMAQLVTDYAKVGDTVLRPLNVYFRAVHDALVHIPHRLTFGPVDEFKAFQIHARIFVRPFGRQWGPGHWIGDTKDINALRALATETLAQSAWFAINGRMSYCAVCGEHGGSTGSMSNLVHAYGPVGHEFKPTTKYPPQKACLLPDALIVEALELEV